MSDTRTDGWNSQLWIYLLAVLICIFPFPLFGFPQLTLVVEKYILYTLVGILSIQHFHYGYSVVSEMCQHFGIKCFTVSPYTQHAVVVNIKKFLLFMIIQIFCFSSLHPR